MPKRIHFVVTAHNEDIFFWIWYDRKHNEDIYYLLRFVVFFHAFGWYSYLVSIKVRILIDSYFVAIFMWLSGFCNYLPFKLPESLPFYVWTCCTVIAGTSVYKSTSRPKNGGFNHIRWWGWNTTFPSNKEKGKTSCKQTYDLKYTSYFLCSFMLYVTVSIPAVSKQTYDLNRLVTFHVH